MEALFPEPLFATKVQMLSRPEGFILYGKLVADFFSTSELLFLKTEMRLRLSIARLIF